MWGAQISSRVLHIKTESQIMTWTEAIKGFLIALPELVKLSKPLLILIGDVLGPHPEKKAAELGNILRDLVESSDETDLAKKKAKKHDALKKLADFVHSN